MDSSSNEIEMSHQLPAMDFEQEYSSAFSAEPVSGLEAIEPAKIPLPPSPSSIIDSSKALSSLRSEVTKAQDARKLRSDLISTFILGFADGVVTPFSLTAGLNASGMGHKAIIAAGLLELIAGAGSMAGGAFLAALQERDEFRAENQREVVLVQDERDEAIEEVAELFREFDVPREALSPILQALGKDATTLQRFRMAFVHRLHQVRIAHALLSAAVMAVSYPVAGTIPMIPYFCMDNLTHALYISAAIAFVLFSILGFHNGYQAGGCKTAGLKGAAMTVFVGGLGAGISVGVGALLNIIFKD